MKTCTLCGLDISDRTPQASYCLGCVRIIRRKRDRDRSRMGRRGLVMLPRCPRCEGAKPKLRRFCDPCTRVLRADSLRRYYLKSGGAAQHRYGNSPKGKLSRAAYAETHAESVRAAKMRYARRHAAAGRIVQCASVLCPGTFIREARNGARLFCNGCRVLFYGQHYTRRLARLRKAA